MTPARRNPKTFILTLAAVFAAIAAPAQQAPRPAPASVAQTPAEPEVDKPDQMIDTLVFSDDSAIQVLDLLEQLTGKIILRRQDMPSVKINFDSRGPISRQEAVLAMESLLTLNGIMLTNMGERFMKAVPATEVNRHVPQMISGTTLDRDPSQQIYAKLFSLEFLNAEETAGNIINPLLSQNSSTVNFPKANAVLVTDALVNLQRIERIIEEADRPQKLREEIEFIQLDFVQATEMEGRLQNLIQGPLSTYLEGSTSVTADERTNQLIVITHPENMDPILEVVDSIDIDAAPLTSTEVFPLRQAKAEEVVPIIESIISGQQEGREQEAEARRETGGERGPRPERPTSPDGGGQNESGGGGTPALETTVGEIEAGRSLQFSSFVGLSADERTNSIVAFGTSSDLKTLEELIEKIDIPLPQVVIEAIITEVTLSENQASGIRELGFTFDGKTLSFGGESLATGDGENGGVGEAGGGIFGSGFNVTGDTTAIFNAVLRASESDNSVRVLSVPRIVVSHNEEGVINVSESRPIVTGSTSSLDDSTTNVRSNVEFRDIGIQLTVTPLIGADDTVQMDIEQVVDNVAGEITIDGNEQPIIGRREATSTITVNSNDAIILGGLQENRRSDSNSFFPVFGRLPGIRNIFGGDTTDYTRTELVIFLRPRVLRTEEQTEDSTRRSLRNITETRPVIDYLETGEMGSLYMEGSRFKEDLETEARSGDRQNETDDAESGESTEKQNSDPADRRSPMPRSVQRLR